MNGVIFIMRLKETRSILFVTLFLLLESMGHAQSGNLTGPDLAQVQKYEDTIAVWARGVLNAEIEEERIYACHQMIPALARALRVDNSFQYKFPRLENVAIIYPSDSSFRIFSWQLKVNEADYRYFGALQWNSPTLRLIPLSDRSHELPDPESVVVRADQWYGLVYYNMVPFELADKSKAWLLFGYDGHSAYDRRKVIDVLQFKEGKPVFGAPVFRMNKNELRHRIIYQFSADASVRVNYDENEKMIICDHLMEQAGNLPGQGKTMVPEGSYEGFRLEKGIWKYIEEVFPSGNAENQRALRTKKKN